MASRRTVNGELWRFYDGMTCQEEDGIVYVRARSSARTRSFE